MPLTMGQSDPQRWGPAHLVEVACSCADITACEMERYVADIRILHVELEQARIIYAVYPGSDPT